MASSTLTANQAKLKELALNDLYFFGQGVLGFSDFVPHVHGRACWYMQHYPGTEKGMVLPRGFFKTTMVITDNIWSALPERFPHDPWHSVNTRNLIVQNIDTNAAMRVHMIKAIFEENLLFQTLFPEVIPENFNKIRWSDYIADIPRTEKHPEGTFNAAGVGSSLTSRHYKRIYEDDTISPRLDDLTETESRPTKEEIQKAIGFHRSVPNLMIDHKRDVNWFIGTRWCKGDPIGWIREHQPSFSWFEMSVWEDKEKTIPIYPERFDLEVLAKLKAKQGSYLFASQYENNPVDEAQMIFEDEWLRFYTDDEPTDGLVYMAVDPAISEKRKSDSIVIAAVMLRPNRDVVVLEYIERKATKNDPDQTINEVFEMAARRKPLTIWVETIAYQKALKNLLDKEALKRRIYLPLKDFADYSADSKNVMIRGLQPIAQRGNLWMRRWHKSLIQQLKDFPYAAHDDVANAVAIVARMGVYPGSSTESRGKRIDLEHTLADAIKEIRARKRGAGGLIAPQVDLTPSDVRELIGLR
jgi:phage terminase large subunit-like protein